MPRFTTTLIALCLAVTCLAPATAQQEQEEKTAAKAPRPLEVEDHFRLGRVSDPRISPDGKWVAFVVGTCDLAEDECFSRIWMAPVDGGDAVPSTREDGSAAAPRWSPDGRYLSFLDSRDEGETQVWTLFRHGGEAVQLTDEIQGVKAYEWSPDGKRLALVIQDPTPAQAEAADKDEEPEEKTSPPWVITRQQFKTDYVGYLDTRRTHLYVLDLESEEMTRLTFGDFDADAPVWSPDGAEIAFVSNRTDHPDGNYNTDIWAVAADGSAGKDGLRRLTSNPGPDHSPAWSPDGKTIAYVAATDIDAIVYATNHLAAVAADGTGERILTGEIDRWVYSPDFDSAGDILFLLEDDGEQALARISSRGGSVERLIDGEQVVSGFSPGPDGALAVRISEPWLPPEIFLHRDGELARISHVNDDVLASLELGAVENVRFESADGTEIESYVVKPPGFREGVRYPVILRIHGGPVSQYDWSFHFEAQLYAANGYLVVMPNPRGSSGYGQPFSQVIWRAWGEKDYEDVVAGVDWVVEQGWGDGERTGVGGWSYGGMLTNHVITRTGRFQAAITGASATLYVVNYGHDQYQRWWEYELGLPWEEEAREIYERMSPFNRVANVTTPTLILGGERDWNVPIINSEQLYLALKRLGVTTELVVYPGEFHGIATPSYVADLYQRRLDWYDRHVKGESEAPSEPPF